MTAAPGYDEVVQLPVLAETVVWRDHIDANGHMNIRHHLEFDARGTGALVEQLGVDDAYRAQRGMGLFTAEHHLRYYSELYEGTRVTVHVRALERGTSSAHLMAFLVDRDQRRLSNTLEVLTVHVDLGSRRPTPMPTEIASGFDRHIAMGDELGWAAPTCGAIAVRRPVPHLGWLRHSIGSTSC